MANKQQQLNALLASMDDMNGLYANIKSMIFGRMGTGKTVHGMMMLQRFTPSDKKIVYVDSHEGWVSFNNHPELKDRVIRIPFQGLSQIDTLVMAINEKAPGFENIGAIMFDELSSIETIDVGVVQVARAEMTGEFAQPTLPDMGVTTYRMRKCFAPVIKLDVHVVFISHLRDDEIKTGTKATGKFTARPYFMNKLGEDLKSWVHEVTYMYADNTNGKYTRLLQVRPTLQVDAKTRILDVPNVVSPAAYLDAMDKWLGGNAGTIKAVPDAVEVSPVESVESAAIVITD
jgi:hypothetical protein